MENRTWLYSLNCSGIHSSANTNVFKLNSFCWLLVTNSVSSCANSFSWKCKEFMRLELSLET